MSRLELLHNKSCGPLMMSQPSSLPLQLLVGQSWHCHHHWESRPWSLWRLISWQRACQSLIRNADSLSASLSSCKRRSQQRFSHKQRYVIYWWHKFSCPRRWKTCRWHWISCWWLCFSCQRPCFSHWHRRSLIGDLTSHANNIVSVTVNLSLAMPILLSAAPVLNPTALILSLAASVLMARALLTSMTLVLMLVALVSIAAALILSSAAPLLTSTRLLIPPTKPVLSLRTLLLTLTALVPMLVMLVL